MSSICQYKSPNKNGSTATTNKIPKWPRGQFKVGLQSKGYCPDLREAKADPRKLNRDQILMTRTQPRLSHLPNPSA